MNQHPVTLRGFATVSFSADDLEEAARWYAELTGVEPYHRFPHDGHARLGPMPRAQLDPADLGARASS